jgi:glycerol kinase
VVRSGCDDLSALGAAWFGGLALGWWKSLAELERQPQSTDTFLPQRSAADMNALYTGWRNAVSKARLPGAGAGGKHA